jgi:hypothetical protein
MISRILASLALGAACLFAAASVDAQQTNDLDQCRDEAVRRQISGDRLSGFLTNCMQERAAMRTQPSGTMDRRVSYDRCRSEGIARGLSGDALYNSVSDCLSRSGAADATMVGTYQQCRADARARGLSGTQLDEYLNSCISR